MSVKYKWRFMMAVAAFALATGNIQAETLSNGYIRKAGSHDKPIKVTVAIFNKDDEQKALAYGRKLARGAMQYCAATANVEGAPSVFAAYGDGPIAVYRFLYVEGLARYQGDTFFARIFAQEAGRTYFETCRAIEAK